MVVELLIASASCHVELVRVPELGKGRLDVVLVHSKYLLVLVSALLADKSAIGNVYVCGLLLLAVDTECIELVVGDHIDELLPEIL